MDWKIIGGLTIACLGVIAATIKLRAAIISSRGSGNAARAIFRSYLEPIVNRYQAEDACAMQADYSHGNLMDWKEFARQTKAVHPHVIGVKAAFGTTCKIMDGVDFGDYGDRPKNQAAKEEFLKRLRQVLHFARP